MKPEHKFETITPVHCKNQLCIINKVCKIVVCWEEKHLEDYPEISTTKDTFGASSGCYKIVLLVQKNKILLYSIILFVKQT